tara:strand:+ start:649 stop:798 length:150 start_codon:yes stop_codon:yes gene_type:complete
MIIRKDNRLIKIDRYSFTTDREYYCEIIKQKKLDISPMKKENIVDIMLK